MWSIGLSWNKLYYREAQGHTWISDLMLAKCVSMAPPWGKFWFILFMSSVKQLKARASGERVEEKQSTLPLPKVPE